MNHATYKTKDTKEIIKRERERERERERKLGWE